MQCCRARMLCCRPHQPVASDLPALAVRCSEATVWRAVSRDALGQQHAPAVVKLGPNRSIAQERVALELRLRSPGRSGCGRLELKVSEDAVLDQRLCQRDA